MPPLSPRNCAHARKMADHDVSMASSMPQTRSPAAIQRRTSAKISNPVADQDSLAAPAAFTQHGGSCAPSRGVSPPAANVTPPEILLQIYSMLTPRDFDNARRTCSQWMRVSLNRSLLEGMLKRAGWWDAYLQDCEIQRMRRRPLDEGSDVWRMSRRFATECLLSGRKSNVERPGFVATEVVDFSDLAQGKSSRRLRGALPSKDRLSHSASTFSVSSCSNYLLVTTGCMIYVFRLLGRKTGSLPSASLDGASVIPISSVECPLEVLSATMDTSASGFVVAALLRNRVGMVCDLDVSERTAEREHTVHTAIPVNATRTRSTPKSRRANAGRSSPHYYYNVCSDDHPPRTVALLPGRRCVAFGCAGGIEIHWVDETTQQDQCRHFPMSQPSEILHFLPNSPGSPMDLRLISSLAGPGVHERTCRQSSYPDHPKKCQFHLLSDVQSFRRGSPANTSALSLARATHCHHYRAVPINDGFHIIFVEPRTGLLCIGSDAPIGGPTSLTRAFVCVPPFGKDSAQSTKEFRSPTAFTVGSDLKWGLRVVAAYQDRIVLYSIPLDVFNVIRKERERQSDGVMGDGDPARDWFVDSERFRKRRESLVQNQNGDWEFLLSVSYQPTAIMWPFKIYGKEIGRVENVVELAMQSANGGARVWAFGASGEATILDVDTFSADTEAAGNRHCKVVSVGSNGRLGPIRLVDRAELDSVPLKQPRKRKATELRDSFVGRYGVIRHVPGMIPDGLEPVTAQIDDWSIRRPSFAACIVDFKIPELCAREGPWRNGGRA